MNLRYFSTNIQGKDLYGLLNVSRGATRHEIKKQFFKLSLKYHPDRQKNSLECTKLKFQEIIEAYKILSDFKNRKEYDQFLQYHSHDGKSRFSNDTSSNSQGASFYSNDIHPFSRFHIKSPFYKMKGVGSPHYGPWEPSQAKREEDIQKYMERGHIEVKNARISFIKSLVWMVGLPVLVIVGLLR